MYDLYAVSNHYGGLGGGHYTAYCQVEGQGWCNFDDTFARPMDAADLEAEGAQESAYVLFYRRQTEAGALCCLPSGLRAAALAQMCQVVCQAGLQVHTGAHTGGCLQALQLQRCLGSLWPMVMQSSTWAMACRVAP